VLLVELGAARPDLRLTGVDLSGDMIASARRNLAALGERATVEVGDVTSLPFADDSFDLIVSSLSLHHWDDPRAAVPELARVLRPGGRVYVYDFPFAPFELLADAARDLSVLNGQTPQRTPIRTGVAFLRCVRYAMAA
jgi:ubiquinone/menaquinone biosynthesis C-methylase UbiE